MPSAFVFQLKDTRFAPSFELLRRIAQPLSTSTPHITVRYPVDLLSAADLSMYESARVERVRFEYPGTFSDRADTDAVSTVFVKCASEELEALSYKPDFPDSIFHLSLYDGAPSVMANQMLEVLSDFPWRLEGKFQPTPLTRIPIGRSKKKQSNLKVRLSAAGTRLLKDMVGHATSVDALLDMSDEDRLKLIYRVAEGLHAGGDSMRPQASVLSRVTVAPRMTVDVQPDLWGEVSVDGDGRREALLSRSAKRSISQGHRPVGLFLTPPELAHDLVMAGLESHQARKQIDFGDPAIGSGIFFASLLRNVDPSRIRSAVGVELDPHRAEVTADRWRLRNLTVLTGPFPDVDVERETRSLIIANPPYVRSQSLDSETALRWRQHIEHELNLELSGRSDLYMYMILACHRWMMPGAVAVWLLPSEFGQTHYGQALRTYLTSNVQLLRVHSYDSAHPLFENARVSSTAVVFQNRPPDEKVSVRVSQGGSLERPKRTRFVSRAELAKMPKWGTQLWLGDRPREHRLRLGDLFRVRRGIATGANSRFVLSAQMVEMLKVPRRWRKPVVPKSRMLRSNIIDARSNGDPDVFPLTWLIDTNEPPNAIAAEAPEFAGYLSEIEAEVGESRLVQSRNPFYSQERHPPSPFLFSSMSRSATSVQRGPFYLNRSVAVNLNNFHSLYPRFAMSDLESLGLKDSDVLDTLLRIDDEEYAREGRVYVSGLRKVEPRELPELRLGAAPREVVSLLSKLAARTGPQRALASEDTDRSVGERSEPS